MKRVKEFANSGKEQEEIKKKYPELYEAFSTFVYSKDCKNRKLRSDFKNPSGRGGIKMHRMIKILEQNGYVAQIMIWKP